MFRRFIIAVFVVAVLVGGVVAVATVQNLRAKIDALERAHQQLDGEVAAAYLKRVELGNRIDRVEGRLGIGRSFTTIESRIDDLEDEVARMDRRLSSCISAISLAIGSQYSTGVYC